MSHRRFWLDPPRILAAQMSLIDHSFAIGMAGCFLAALLVGATLYVPERAGAVLLWVAAMGGLCLGAVRGRHWLPDRLGEAGCRRYALCMSLVLSVCGLLWGLLTPLWLDFDAPVQALTLLGVTAGMNAAALALFCLCRPVATAFCLASVTPPWLSFLASDRPEAVPLSIGIPLFLVMMLIFIHRHAATLRRSIELNQENLVLLERLRGQMAEVQAAQRRAERADRAKAVILASASHDLRQPLHALGLFLVALRRSALQPAQQDLLEQAMGASRATEELLDTLLDYSRLDAGVIRPRPEAFALQPLLYRLERALAAEAEARGLVYRSRDSALCASADPRLVELILRNLIINAIRHTRAGGVLVGVRRRGDRLRIEVWDTGVGIPLDQHDRIFEAFQQIGNPQRDRRKGLGLGLAIVDGLAATMGVRVELASRPGRGSVFSLCLPVSAASETESQASPVPVEVPGDWGFRQVLVIDDDSINCQAMAALFQAWGRECRTCEDLDEALVVLASGFTPDVLIADYRLRNNRTGLQAIEALQMAGGRWVPAFLVTGDTAPERLREVQDSGVPVLHKPVSALALEQMLCALWLDISRSPEETPY